MYRLEQESLVYGHVVYRRTPDSFPFRVLERLRLHGRLADSHENLVLLGQFPDLVHHEREQPLFECAPQAVDFAAFMPDRSGIPF